MKKAKVAMTVPGPIKGTTTTSYAEVEEDLSFTHFFAYSDASTPEGLLNVIHRGTGRFVLRLRRNLVAEFVSRLESCGPRGLWDFKSFTGKKARKAKAAGLNVYRQFAEPAYSRNVNLIQETSIRKTT